MRALIQRVKEASVYVDGICHSSIEKGLLIFLGIKQGDTKDCALNLAERCVHLRIFEDQYGKMNLSVNDVGGSILVVSQFTLYADTNRGHRPSFTDAAPPDIAEILYNEFVEKLKNQIGDGRVKTGIFRAMMDVHLINDGPVTITLESK